MHKVSPLQNCATALTLTPDQPASHWRPLWSRSSGFKLFTTARRAARSRRPTNFLLLVLAVAGVVKSSAPPSGECEPNSDDPWLVDDPRGDGAGGRLPPENGEAGAHHLGGAEADAGRGRPQECNGPASGSSS